MASYEFTKAQEFSASNPDNIHYDKDAAFRNQDYRQVFHQEGTIGTFSVRLLEAAGLSRNYWSALALGPMKHLGLSKAHGGVSSSISFCLDTTATSKYKRAATTDYDQKMPSTKTPQRLDYSNFVSPVVPNDNNPVWTNCQFEIPLKKGVLHDGQSVRIALRVDEDATAIENIIPGIPSAGGAARLLGIGNLDVTSLCLGQNPATGQQTTGVIDTWVPIKLPDEHEQDFSGGAYTSVDENLLLHKSIAVDDLDQKMAATPSKKEDSDDEKSAIPRVRLSITYTPHGMTPQKNDVVALEAFARQNSSTATCNSILPPLLPLHVVEYAEPWLLVRYSVPDDQNGYREYPDEPNTSDDDRKAHMRIHRNAVFVIERKNLLDGALNLALQPAELLLATPLGQGAREALGPVLVASKQLLMPALVSSKLLWMAVRTTALAGITGVSAASSAFVNEGASSLTRDNNRRRSTEVSRVRYV